MARKIFFSFHYDDVTRANVVRNSDQITRLYTKTSRFHDLSLWEKAKKQGPLAIKRMINEGLSGTSVTCVLIGRQTWQRPWVRYEILKSLARGNGILGIQIHHVGFAPSQRSHGQTLLTGLLSGGLGLAPQQGQMPLSGLLSGLPPQQSQMPLSGLLSGGLGLSQQVPPAGLNPLRFLGYTVQQMSVKFHEVGIDNKWREYPELDSESLSNLRWMSLLKDAGNLEELFRVYDWKSDHGSMYFPTWIEEAARQVGR